MAQQSRRILRLIDVKHQVGLGRTTIYQKIKAGEFPKPVSLGARAVGWHSDLIEAWIDSRVSASGATA